MNNVEKVRQGLEISFKKLIEFKKYKKTPLIILRDGKIEEIDPESLNSEQVAYK